MTAYDLRLERPSQITDLKFPDITKLGSIDRDHDLLQSGRNDRRLSEEEMLRLELRSKFYEDLGVGSIDEYFLGGGRDCYGYTRRPETLAGKGATKVLHAVRTFTTDTDLINYRLDVQDDFSDCPDLIPAMQQFYGEVVEAAGMHFEAYAIDCYKHKITDQWGRYVFKKWEDLPKSFAKVDKAINDFKAVLAKTKSQGMREVRDFLDQVQAHPIYQGWTQYAGQVYDGGRYFLAFDYEPADGARVAIQLGKVVPGSTLDGLLNTKAEGNGEIPHHLSEGLVVKRVTGLVRNEFGHMMQEITSLNFDSLDMFCRALTSGMEEQLSFYAALGSMYGQWDELGIPVSRPVFNEGDGIEIREVIHPTVAALAMKDRGKYTLNDFVANSESNGIVVTGPNDGGKTASGKGFGISAALAQAGIRVPARYFRMEAPVREIYTHFILKEEVQDRKGRHKNELVRARKLCEVMTPDDLLLYDEPCGGTDVKSGLIDSANLLRYAWQVNIPLVFVTHIHEFAELVERGEYPGIRNMQAEILEIDGELQLTHKIIPGRAKESYGSRISAEVGVTQKDLDRLLAERVERGELDPSRIRRDTRSKSF